MKPIKEWFKKRDVFLLAILIFYAFNVHWSYQFMVGILYLIYREKVDHAEDWCK